MMFISKETIRPSSPTPPHLKIYNLSFLDQLNPSINIPVVFFYPNCTPNSQQDIASQLKKSLSETLTQCYPLAGRYVSAEDGSYVDCNDEGVDFLEVRIDASLSNPVRLHELDQFFPTDMESAWLPPSKGWSSLVKVQLTNFSCGGIALAVSLCHKIGDARSFFNFMNHWAAVTQGSSCNNDHEGLEPLPPQFFPNPKTNVYSNQGGGLVEGENCVSKKFVFPNSKLALLKAKVMEEDQNLQNPTRVEVLSSLLYACAVRSSKANSRNPVEGHGLLQSVNLRKKMAQPLPDSYMGNMVGFNLIRTMKETEVELNSLTTQIKNGKMQLTDITKSQMIQLLKKIGEVFTLAGKNEIKLYLCTSFCWFGAYDVDFGWGKPIRVGVPGCPEPNYTILMENESGDGLEAVVTLEEEEMAIFQNDDQLLAYCL